MLTQSPLRPAKMLKGLKTEIEEEMNTATFPSGGRLLASLIQGW